ncbi:hypothetical protein [Streptomyces sp. NPDC050988]|uniref:hypothetical protein n=1 Tax=Streptomyces sp. NPDC050988 TaxID=3365637 RepID=UPI0037926781
MTENPEGSAVRSTAVRGKRRNAVLALYDSPVYRDWAFWMTVGWGLMTAVSIPGSDQPNSLPVWLDTLLAVLTFVTLFGVIPTWLRLLFRQWLRRRNDRSPRSSVGTPLTAGHGTAPASAQRPALPAVLLPPQPSSEPSQRRPPPPRAHSPRQPQVAPSPQRLQQGLPDDPGLAKAGIQPLSSSAVMSDARTTMPHPVARAIRTIQQANTSKEQYEALLDAAEILAISASVTAAALLQRRIGGSAAHPDESNERSLSMLRSSLLAGGGATFGTWTNWLDALRPLAASRPEVVPGLPNALHSDEHTTGLIGHLNALRTERNRAAHGDRPQSAGESGLRVEEIRPHLEHALMKAEFLTQSPWLLTVSCSYQPRTQTFDVVAHNAMGDHPDFERREFSWTSPVANEVFYVLTAEGPVTLSPFVASLFCPQCQQMEVCYAARADKRTGPAILKSFARGHTLHSADLGDEIRSLPDHRRGTTP